MIKQPKTPDIDPRAHKRALRFLNAARTPQDLLELPQNEVEVLVDPERRRKRPDLHERIEKKPPVKLFDLKQAERVLNECRKLSPLYGFTHIDQLENILGGDAFKRIIDLILKWFSGVTYGEWSDPISLTDEDGSFSVVHAAVVHTGDVLMIEHACHPGVSKTPLWDPVTRTLKPAPLPPPEGLYCSGHCFLSYGKLLVVGGRGDANHWYGEKKIAWLFDPDTGTWDYTRDKTTPPTPGPRTYMNHSRWYPTLVNLGDEPGRVLVASGDNTEHFIQ